MSEYTEKFKDPRWQKKRLEIMERDNFECLHCGDTKSMLNVHHTHYIGKADPWDYPDESLMTLCNNCHIEEHERKKAALDNLKLLCNAFETAEALEELMYFIQYLILLPYYPYQLAVYDFQRFEKEYIETWEKCCKKLSEDKTNENK